MLKQWSSSLTKGFFYWLLGLPSRSKVSVSANHWNVGTQLHLCDGSGQGSVLLQVGGEGVRTIDGGCSFIPLNLKNVMTSLWIIQFSLVGGSNYCSFTASVPGTLRRSWCSACTRYSGRRSPPPSCWMPPRTRVPNTHTRTWYHHMTCCRCERCWSWWSCCISPVWPLLLTSSLPSCCRAKQQGRRESCDDGGRWCGVGSHGYIHIYRMAAVCVCVCVTL